MMPWKSPNAYEQWLTQTTKDPSRRVGIDAARDSACRTPRAQHPLAGSQGRSQLRAITESTDLLGGRKAARRALLPVSRGSTSVDARRLASTLVRKSFP